MDVLRFFVATAISQLAGAWTYRRAKTDLAFAELPAAVACGLATTVVAALAYTFAHVHEWILGPGTNWAFSVFLAVCIGLCQGMVFRGRPFVRGWFFRPRA